MKKCFNKTTINILFLSIVIIALLLVSFIVKPFSKAEESDIEGFSGGSGTSDDPYLISTTDDLINLADRVNSTDTSKITNSAGILYKNAYYELTNDIDCSSVTSNPIIGNDTVTKDDNLTDYSFQGNFNGKGYAIKNLNYTFTEYTKIKMRVGLFGMLLGDGTNNASVYNLIIDNMNISLDFASNEYAFMEITVGTIAGHVGENASVRNCIVKNSSIIFNKDETNPKFVLNNKNKLLLGGIVGETSKNGSNSGWNTWTPNSNYGIENCFADVDITVNDKTWTDEDLDNEPSDNQGYYSRYGIRGIVGGFCNVNKFPQNCIYQGTLSATKAFVGPIFGRGEFSTLKPKEYSKLYAAIGSTDTTPNSNYYYDTTIVNKALETSTYILDANYKSEDRKTQITDDTGYIYPLDKNATTVTGFVQGVNRGDYIENLETTGLNLFLSYSVTKTKYMSWIYENSSFSFDMNSKTEEFSGGKGTEKNPYLISSVEDIVDLANKVNTTDSSINQNDSGLMYKKAYYKLIKDIDFVGITSVPIIGYDTVNYADNSTDYAFQGDFNGDGHSIKNINQTITKIPTLRNKIGLFGMLWGDGTNNASVYNLIIDNMNITLDAVVPSSGYVELTAGIIAGHLGQNASIRNCIVKNSSITLTSKYVLPFRNKLQIGGIVGDTSRDATNDGWNKWTPNDNYGIENCFSNTNITINDDAWEKEDAEDTAREGRYCRYGVGGIVGGFCNVNKFPKNCIYQGTITATKAFIGPIFGRGEFSSTSPKDYIKLYAASESTDKSEDSNYYYKTKIVNNLLSPSTYELNSEYLENRKDIDFSVAKIYPLLKKSETPINTMAYVQGVNSGKLTETLVSSEIITKLNSYSGIGTKYKEWGYSDNSLVFGKSTAFVLTNDDNKYKINVINSTYKEGELKYKWYINDVLQDNESDEIIVEPNISEDRILKCEIYANGELKETLTKSIKKSKISISIGERKDNKEILYADITTNEGSTKDDFTYQWYYKTEDMEDYNIIVGENDYELDTTRFNAGVYLKVVIKSNKYSEFIQELYYTKVRIVYLDETNGNNNNDGATETAAVKTLEKAYELLPSENSAQNNIIVVMGDYTSAVYTQTKKENSKVFNKPATISGKYLNTDYSSSIGLNNNIYINDNTIIKNITITPTGGYGLLFMYAQGNDLTLEESVKISKSFNMTENQAKYWGLQDVENYKLLKQITIVGGTLNYKKSTHDEIKTRTSTITVKTSGIAVITGGSRTQGDLNSEVYGTIDKYSNVKINVDIPESDSNIDVGLVVGGQCDSSCYINNEINIQSGKIGSVIGGTLGYGNEYNNPIPSDTFYGSSIININGGTINKVFGGPLGRNKPTSYMYGQVEININGGTIKDVYGAGSGGTMGYSELSTDTFKDNEIYGVSGKTMTRITSDGTEETYKLDEAKVTINITGGTIENSVYGGGYGKFTYCEPNPVMASDGGNLYGDICINITGGTIKQNVYGGSKGAEPFSDDKTEIAQIYGDIDVNILENANIQGNVYGGSEGNAQYPNMSKITGNIDIDINGKNINITGGKIFGGGKSGKIDGIIHLNLNDTDLKTDVYGAGDGANATLENSKFYSDGDDNISVENIAINLIIQNSTIDGTIYGGGNSANVYAGILVEVTDNSNIINAIYGGCNQADVGTADLNQNTYVYVSDAVIGSVSNDTISGGEVFGGGNLGKIYGSTQIEIGSESDKVSTKVGNQVYAGGRGTTGQTTVTENSIGMIIGTNTAIMQYGSSELGIVDKEVNIYFDNYKNTNSNNKYKTMTGLNKATAVHLINSYVYLTGGLSNIQNLDIPENSGIMISEDSILDGNFAGGGELNIQSGATLTVNGELSNKTKLTLNAKQENDGTFQILGGEDNPYVVVSEKDKDKSETVSDKKTGMYSGDSRYIIENKNEQESIYYIKDTVTMNEGATEKISNITDKVYTSAINNTEDIYILDNDAVSSDISVNYTMLRRKNGDNWEFVDSTSMKNVKRYLYLTGKDSAMLFPANTAITMIKDGKYYRHIVDENGETEISLASFKDLQNKNYEEVTDIQSAIKENINNESTSNIISLATPENYRFVIDFSNCQNAEQKNNLYGDHEILLGIIDEKSNENREKIHIEYSNSNIVRIENRNFNIATETIQSTEKGKMNFKVKLTANSISSLNKSDLGKSIKYRISLLNQNAETINIPQYVKVSIDGTEQNLVDNEVIYQVVQGLETNAYDKTIDLEIDMSDAPSTNYYLKVEAYLANDDTIQGNNPVASQTKEFTFDKAKNYGIKVSSNNKLITDEADTSRIVNIKFSKGNLEGAYINVKCFVKQDGFKYTEYTKSTVAKPDKITDLTENNESNIYFSENGIYRIVYQLCDSSGNVLTEDLINFIVKID